MEIAIAAACGLTAWLCAFALARSSGAPTPRALRRLRAGRRVRGVVRGVARLPLVRALARRPSWVRTSRELCERAGLQGASDDEAVSLLVLLSVLAAALLSLVSRSLVGAVVAAVALAVGIPAMDAARERRRKAELVRSMPSVFRTLSMALASGETLSQAEIDHYIDKYRPYDKAGAYGIQEWIGYVGISAIEGSFYNVMGFPVHRVWHALQRFL